MAMVLSRAIAVGSGPNRLLRAFLWCVAGTTSILGLRELLDGYPKFADIETPLRAAERWLAGGQPYLASAFQAGPGYDVPFLYPPFVLPLVAPLTLLPREVVWAAWLGICVGAGLLTLRRLGVPWPFAPLLLLWPPFTEAILGGNVQLVLVAGFVLLFFNRPARTWAITARDPADEERPAAADGFLGAAIPAFKLSQPHAWLALLRRRPLAAFEGLAIVGGLALVTLPLVGLDSWVAWTEQLRRATDPAWALAGASLTAAMPPWVGLGLLAATALLCLIAPVPRLGAWTGILTTVGAPSLRMFGTLYALPAMLIVRREIALAAAALIATYTLQGLWIGLFLVLGTLLAAERYPALREPGGA